MENNNAKFAEHAELSLSDQLNVKIQSGQDV
jgi:hypothetical protein